MIPKPSPSLPDPAGVPAILSSAPVLIPPARAASPRATSRSLAEAALGSRSVKRIRRFPGVEVWARRTISKRRLLRAGHHTGVVVVCLATCRIDSQAALASGRRALRASRTRSAVDKTPGQSEVLSLRLDPRSRAALRRARRARADFKLVVTAAGKKKSLRRSIRIGR